MQVKNLAILGQVADGDLRLLRVFKSVVDCGGIASAELELNIAMSTISRHLKDLEQRLGLTLCRRGRGGFALTAEGAQVYEAACDLLAATSAFRGRVRDIHSELGGELRLAIFEKTVSNPRSRIAHAVRAFQQRIPQARLSLHVGSIVDIERGVLDGRYDLGIIPEHRRSSSLRYQELFLETMQLYAGRQHRWFDAPRGSLGWDDLRQQRLAALGYHSPNMELTHQRGLVRAATASDQEAVATLILSDQFVGFLPDHYAQPFVDAGRMRAVCAEVFHYSCCFSSILRASPQPTRLAQAFGTELERQHATARRTIARWRQTDAVAAPPAPA